MRVSGIANKPPVNSPMAAALSQAAPAAQGRALVVLAPPAPIGRAPAHYRQAPFLAQLLAMKHQHPQTRERRRAEPNDALAAYRATVKLTRFG
jgi:hypothetical protein